MGAFKERVHIADRDGQNGRDFEALVDTGAAYSLLPETVLHGIGIEPFDTMAIQYGDGGLDRRPIGRAEAEIDGRSAETIVIFGPDNAQPLLGAYTLQGLRLMVDSPNERLVPLPVATA